ncbi:MAG: 2-oxo acid dehydrogenase subunit E2 [Phycisphaerales bacterium]
MKIRLSPKLMTLERNMTEQTTENPKGGSVKLSRIQKLIGRRMLESKLTKPCFYLSAKADVSELMDNRHKLKKATGVKVTTNAFYIRALATSALKYPLTLARSDGENLRIAEAVNIGFAVNAPQGLVVPVIKNADKMSVIDIARAEKLLTNKSRANELTLDELSSETIALSNLGAYGIDSFFGIVPPPASVILSAGNVLHEVVPKNGKPIERRIVSLTLAVDHKIIDGDYAAKFLSHITTLLAKPDSLIKE